ncbi:MAG: hypothetical protein KA154_16110 [Gemmatimonadaceae bacterium]|nr:hypothetical protein [Gemmatimonadaceae bacterium]MCC6431332.1 hypothetical protein [Gemmatimonadaceae bacterium]
MWLSGNPLSSQTTSITYSDAHVSKAPLLIASKLPLFETSAADDRRLDVEDVQRATFVGEGELLWLGSLPSRLVLVRMASKTVTLLGREGEGPGDFRALRDISVVGDTILFSDMTLLRLSRVRKNGSLLSSRLLPRVDLRMVTRIAGIANDGSVLLFAAGSPTDFSDPNATHTVARIYSLPKVGPPVLIKSLPDLRLTAIETRYRGVVRSRREPIRLAGGVHVAFVSNTLGIAHADTFRLTLFTPRGTALRSISFLRPRRFVSPAMKALSVDREMETRVTRPRSEPLLDPVETARQVRVARYADSLPALHTVLTSPDGVFWLVESIAPGDSGWTAVGISAAGTLVGRIRSDFAGVPLAIEPNRVLVREIDHDGAAVVRVRALAKSN